MATVYGTDRTPNDYIKIGRYYGFPACCTRFFAENVGNAGWHGYTSMAKLHGTGYIPCPGCNQKTEQALIVIINQHRIQETVFPNGDDQLMLNDLALCH